MIELESGGARAVVDPDAGGRLASLSFDGHELLLAPDPDNPLVGGLYPMVPWAGRLRDGVLHHEGHDYHLPATLLPPHAIHGTCVTRAWVTDGHGPSWARLSIGLDAPWPFGGQARQLIRLAPDGITLVLEVHADDQPMPAIVGWHPWFLRRLAGADGPGQSAQLRFQARSQYERGPDGLPTGRTVEPTPGPWDDCFTGVARWPQLRWPGIGVATVRSSADHWVVYDEPADAICVEPQTGPPDGLNQAHRLVLPGLPLVADASVGWQPETPQA